MLCIRYELMKNIKSILNDNEAFCNNIFGIEIGSQIAGLGGNLQTLQNFLNNFSKIEFIDQFITKDNRCFALGTLDDENFDIFLESLTKMIGQKKHNIIRKYCGFKSIDSDILKAYSNLQGKYKIENLYCLEASHIFDLFLGLNILSNAILESVNNINSNSDIKLINRLKIIEFQKNSNKPYCLFSVSNEVVSIVDKKYTDLSNNITNSKDYINKKNTDNIIFGEIPTNLNLTKINNVNSSWLNYFNC